jgi:hypothetical protein
VKLAVLPKAVGATGVAYFRHAMFDPTGTSFHETTRNAEVVIIPTSGVFEKYRWTTELSIRPTSAQAVTGKTGVLWECNIDANNYYALKVGADGKPYVEVKADGTTYTVSSASAPVLTVGTDYVVGAVGDGSLIHLYVDGKRLAVSFYKEPSGALPTNMYLGGDSSGANQANALFSEVMFTRRPKSEGEMMAGALNPLG